MQPADWAIIAAYGAVLLFLGWRASRAKSDTVDSHLRADRSLPAWAVVFSILATEVSGASYIGVPQSGYLSNWNYMQFAVGALLGKWVLGRWFIRLYWRLGLDTVYGFLGQQIGPGIQRATAWAFLAGRFIGTGVRLFISAIAFATVSHVDIYSAIAVMAAISLVFTMFGGLRAVVWTDVAQGILIVLGAGSALAFGLWKIGLPLGDLIAEASAANKLEFISWSADGKGWLFSDQPFLVAILGGFLLVLATHGTDQENVQQLLSSRSERASGRSIVASGIFTFPIVTMFLCCGTMLWLYGRHVGLPTGGSASVDASRSLFPNFIEAVLPTGLRGLAFAGLLAASIAGSTLNAATSTWMSDIAPRRDGGSGTRRVRRLTIVFGGILAAVGMFFARYTQGRTDQLITIALNAMTMVYGGILGTFLCALLFKRRGSDRSAVLGLCAGVACGFAGFFQTTIADWLSVPWTPIVWPWQLLISTSVTLLVAASGRRA